MDRLYRNLNLLLPLVILIVLSSCTREKEVRAAYTFFFVIIFILFCVPGVILSGISRNSKGTSAKVIGIILTSIGAFFGLFYTFNFLENDYASRDNQITAFVLMMWATLVASAILLLLPKPQNEVLNTHPTAPKTPQVGKVFQSEEEILREAERIKRKKAQQETTDNSQPLNKDVASNNVQGKGSVDMSGLDDL